MAMGERLDLGILGPLSAGVDGQRLKITSARQRTILALLVLRPDQVVTADTLVDSIWPRSQPATARTQVSICVAALRKLFASLGVADGVIVTEHPGYRLNSAGHEIDWVLFEQDVAQALSKGLSYPQIAEQLGLGSSTVVTHVRSLGQKLGCGGREEIVAALCA